MATFLFWNLNRKPLQEFIRTLVVEHNVDILILAECSIEPGVLLRYLNRSLVEYYYAPSEKCNKIDIYLRFSREFIAPVYELERLTIQHLKLPGSIDILLAALHFPSKLHWDDGSQALRCVELAKKIYFAEQEAGHSRTILVGDLNMNPFEDGVVSANGLHAVMSRDIAMKKPRVVQGERYPFFYNPMWSLFGDASSGPPGTFYYSASTPKTFFWNMFDQVLIRPELLSSFSNNNLQILTSAKNTSLLTKSKRPNAKLASDHLPLLFTLNL